MKNQNDKNIKSIIATEAWAGLRIDKALALDIEIKTRSRALHLIEQSLVRINNKLCKPSQLVKLNDQILVEFPEAQSTDLLPLDLKLEILFEDSDVIVVNKPSGLVVHPAAGHQQDTLVNALIAHTQDLSMKFGENRPGIVHRLDRETSGILVVAKNDSSHENLMTQFKNRTVHRIYEAVVFGRPRADSGKIESYLARHPTDRKKFASLLGNDKKIQHTREPVPEIGKWAITNYKTLKTSPTLSLLQLKLETGRTHQIRVHLSELGHCIFGDVTYGADKRVKNLPPSQRKIMESFERFFLHACRLEFDHPVSGQRLEFFQPWPEDAAKAIFDLGLS